MASYPCAPDARNSVESGMRMVEASLPLPGSKGWNSGIDIVTIRRRSLGIAGLRSGRLGFHLSLVVSGLPRIANHLRSPTAANVVFGGHRRREC